MTVNHGRALDLAVIGLATIGLAVLSLALTPIATLAAVTPPAATAILFDAKHLLNVGKGEALRYRFQRTVSNPKLLGEPFSDDISVDVLNTAPDETREVSVQVFSGERARREQHINGMTGNPVLVVFLDRAVNNFSQLAGGNRPYLKQKMKMALDSGAKIDPVVVSYKGASHDGYRIRVSPYVGDANALKMMGYDGASFEIVVSEKVPGHFVQFSSVYESPVKDNPRLEERIVLDGVEGVK
ncbi:MAG: hypothetical protein KDJ37_11285 [Hyphomicrobiaceae bacterium]|nr:hypothetical protein [Hyphomicrobiaceae bacterium]